MSDQTTNSDSTSRYCNRLREALERAFPVFRMGGLTDAIYPADEGEGEGWALDNADYEILAAAARRFLALTETGPDYEAAKIQLHEILREAGVDVFVNSDLVVDAALADYLTEETK